MACRCSPLNVAGCQCSSDSTTTINQNGSGTAGSPFTYDAILSALTGNKLSIVPDGLLVETLPYLKSYNSNDQNRANGDAVSFDTNFGHGDLAIHSPGGGTNDFFFVITKTGQWELFAAASTLNTNHVVGVNLRWTDADTGDIIGQAGGDGGIVSPGTQQVVASAWLTQGTHVAVKILWNTGAGPVVLEGGGSYGHRTWAYLRCVAVADSTP